MFIHEVDLNEDALAKLISFSEDWAAENSCYGYRPNDKSDIENCLELTEKLNFFYNVESFLSRNLIGKKLEENLTDEVINYAIEYFLQRTMVLLLGIFLVKFVNLSR